MTRLIWFLVVFSITDLVRAENSHTVAYEYAIQDHGGRFQLHEPLNAYVSEIGQRLADVTDPDRDYEFVVLNESDADSWSLPGGKVGVTRGLLALLSNEAQLAAVVANELQHAKKLYGATDTRNLAQSGTALKQSGGANYAIDGAQIPLNRIKNQIHTRIDELQADLHGQNDIAKVGYHPEAFAELLRILLAHDKEESYLTRHKPTDERLQRVEENVRRLSSRNPEGWQELDNSRFEEVFRVIATTNEAYQFVNVGKHRVLWNGLRMVDRAIELMPEDWPREADFYYRKAVLLAEARDCRTAFKQLAISQSLVANRYQDYVLQGECHQIFGDFTEAKKAFTKSHELLPNATATKALAEIAQLDGDRVTAKKNYMKLLAVEGQHQRLAQEAFVELDLADNPGIYFISQSTLKEGELTSVVINQSGQIVRGIEVAFAAKIKGEERTEIVSAGGLPPGGQVQLYPGWYVDNEQDLTQLRVRVVSVRQE